jgi:hypothetical protein
MSIFDKIFGTPEESAKLKKLKEEYAKRLASKSSGMHQKVEGPADVVDQTVTILNKRINNTNK